MTEMILLMAQGCLALTAGLAIHRAARGPSIQDRVLGLELLALVVVGLLLLEARRSELRLYLDAAFALALFSFVGAVLAARVLEEDRSDA